MIIRRTPIEGTGTRHVRTASVAQVREPVYTRSVARWKHYEAALGPLFRQFVPATNPAASPGERGE